MQDLAFVKTRGHSQGLKTQDKKLRNEVSGVQTNERLCNFFWSEPVLLCTFLSQRGVTSFQ